MKPKGINVLLLFPDQWRPDWDASNPSLPLRLPNLKQLTAQGTRFSRAITSSPLCAPSRACFALGLDYDSCPVKGNDADLPLGRETFYAKLRSAGYHVMGCGKMDLAKHTADWGLDGTHPLPGGKKRTEAWGFTAAVDNSGKIDGYVEAKKENYCPYTHFLKDHGLLQTHLEDFAKRQKPNFYRHSDPTPLPDFAYADNFEGEQGMSLLQQVPAGEPWFLQVNFSGPHDPVDVTCPMWEGWRQTAFPAPVQGDPAFSADEHTAARRNYAAMLENIDRWLGTFRKEIERRGETDRTLVIFASDHGEMLGDHGRWGKNIPYQPSMGVPLVAAGLGVKAGVENGSPVTLPDLAATIVEMTGAGNGPSFQDGRSLLPILKGEAASVREVAVSGLGTWRAAFDGQWKLIRGFGGKGELLFDLNRDPHELHNVLEKHPEVVARLSPFLTHA